MTLAGCIEHNQIQSNYYYMGIPASLGDALNNALSICFVASQDMAAGFATRAQIKGMAVFVRGARGTEFRKSWSCVCVLVIVMLSVAGCGGGGGGGGASNQTEPSASGSGGNSGNNSTPVATYRVGGSISGLAASGLVLQMNGGSDLAIDMGSTFGFPVGLQTGSSYSVSVRTNPIGQVCTVSSNGTGIVGSDDVTDVAVVCVTPPVLGSTYTIGGTVSGLTVSGLVLASGGDQLNLSAQTTQFTFPTPMANAATYAVAIAAQPPGLTCGIANAVGTVANSNVTDVTVTCVPTLVAPGLSLDKTSIDFVSEQGAPLASQTIVSAVNGASAVPTVTIAYTTNGIQFAGYGQLTSTSGRIDVTPRPSTRVAGVFHDTITITACYDAACTHPVQGSPFIVPVTTTILPPAPTTTLVLSDHGVAFASVPGRANLSRTLTVRDSSGAATNWTAVSDQEWLVVTPTGASGGNLTLTATAASLADGFYQAAVTIASSDSSLATQTVRVGLYVSSVASATSFAQTQTLFSPKYWLPPSNWVVDPIRPVTYITNGASIDIDHVYTGARVGSITVPGAAYKSMAIGDDGSRLYAVNAMTGVIDVIDLDTQAVRSSLSFPQTGVANAVDQLRVAYARVLDRPVLIVTTMARQIWLGTFMPILDAVTGEQLGTVGQAMESDFDLISVSRDGRMLSYSLAGLTGAGNVSLISLNKNSVGNVYGVLTGATHDISRSAPIQDFAINDDGSRTYGLWDYASAFSLVDGALVERNDFAPFPVVGPYGTGDGVVNVEVNPYGDIVMTTNHNAIRVYSRDETLVSEWLSTQSMAVGNTPKGALRLTSDGLRMLGAGCMLDLR